MALPAEDDVRRTERLYEFGVDIEKRLSNDSQVRLHLLQSRANLAWTRPLALDCVVDKKNHALNLKSEISNEHGSWPLSFHRSVVAVGEFCGLTAPFPAVSSSPRQ